MARMTISQGWPARGPAAIRGWPNLAASRSYSAAAICARQVSAMSDKRAGGGLHVLLAQQVADAHAKLLVVLEAVQDGVDVLGPAAQFGQRLPQRLRGGQLVQHQAVHQAVDHARVAGEDARQVGAVGAEFDVQPQAGRIEAEQLPEHALAAQRVAHLVEVHQRRVGIGRGGDRLRATAGRWRPGSAGSAAWRGSGSSPRPAPSGCDRPASRRGRDTCPAPRRSAPAADRGRAPGPTRPRSRRRR